MENQAISLFPAFLAGILSFLSPCVLPLIPGYISFVSGVSLSEAKAGQKRGQTVTNALLFVLGFSIVFILLGASATFLGKILLNNLYIFNKIAGILIIIFGLQITGLINLSWLNMEKRAQVSNLKSSPLMAFVIGLAFAFGWSPCIGPFLAAILAVAGNQDTVWQGIWLLTAYSLGLGIPFILTALAIDKFFAFFNAIKKYMRWVEIVAGIMLIVIGALIFTNQLARIAYLFWKG